MAADAAIEYLDTDDLLGLAVVLLGEAVALRDAGLLGAAAARPRATVGGADAYDGVWAKAAALLHSIVKNHALVDGNKRLGWLATAVFLEINGHGVTAADDDDVHDLVVHVAVGDPAVAEIASRLQKIVRPRPDR